MLSPRGTAKSARRFLGKELRLRKDCPPETINTENEAYGKAIRALSGADIEMIIGFAELF